MKPKQATYTRCDRRRRRRQCEKRGRRYANGQRSRRGELGKGAARREGGGAKWTRVTQARRTSTRAPRRGRESACQEKGGPIGRPAAPSRVALGGGIGGRKSGTKNVTPRMVLGSRERLKGFAIGEFRKSGIFPQLHCLRPSQGSSRGVWRLGGGGEQEGSKSGEGKVGGERAHWTPADPKAGHAFSTWGACAIICQYCRAHKNGI